MASWCGSLCALDLQLIVFSPQDAWLVSLFGTEGTMNATLLLAKSS